MTRKEVRKLLLSETGLAAMEASSNTIVRIDPRRWNKAREANAYLDLLEAIGLLEQEAKK